LPEGFVLQDKAGFFYFYRADKHFENVTMDYLRQISDCGFCHDQAETLTNADFACLDFPEESQSCFMKEGKKPVISHMIPIIYIPYGDGYDSSDGHADFSLGNPVWDDTTQGKGGQSALSIVLGLHVSWKCEEDDTCLF